MRSKFDAIHTSERLYLFDVWSQLYFNNKTLNTAILLYKKKLYDIQNLLFINKK